MSQQEVGDFLEKNVGKWFLSKEVAESLKASLSTTTTNLSKLMKREGFEYRIDEVDSKKRHYRYKG
jgi:hypothetical protein